MFTAEELATNAPVVTAAEPVRVVRVVKVGEYRRATDAVCQAFASLRGCLRGERPREARWVRNTVSELLAMSCPRATEYDRGRAEGMIDLTAEWLITNGLTAIDARPGGPAAV